jgi:hypothetical protein
MVHGSLIDDQGDEFLRANIYIYEDILRRSIVAFLDLNRRSPVKKEVIGLLDKASTQPALKKELQESLKLLKLTL